MATEDAQDASAAREAIASLLWQSVPSTSDAEAMAEADRMIDAYRAEVLREAFDDMGEWRNSSEKPTS